jgi:hypothetical protein
MIGLKMKMNSPIVLMSLIGILLAVGSIHDNSIAVEENHKQPGKNLTGFVHVSPSHFPGQIMSLSEYQSPVLNDEDEIEPENPLCDPSDRKCACTLSFIPSEYGIFVVTVVLIGIILFLVIIDILNVKKTDVSK